MTLTSADVLGIFVKAPVAGRVKTRLAAAIGAHPAAELYHDLGRRIVAGSIHPQAYRTVVWFTPSQATVAVRSWLWDLAIDEFVPQPRGGLGRRLAATLRRHFQEGAQRVVVIGSDCPGVWRGLVRRAFDALEEADLVIGPAVDGGFYLLGLRAPAPGLFRKIPWSTRVVFDQTLRNARRLGLHMATLSPLRDVDTLADARALGLLEPAELLESHR